MSDEATEQPKSDEDKRQAVYTAALAAADTHVEAHRAVFLAIAEMVERPEEHAARKEADAKMAAALEKQRR